MFVSPFLNHSGLCGSAWRSRGLRDSLRHASVFQRLPGGITAIVLDELTAFLACAGNSHELLHREIFMSPVALPTTWASEVGQGIPVAEQEVMGQSRVIFVGPDKIVIVLVLQVIAVVHAPKILGSGGPIRHGIPLDLLKGRGNRFIPSVMRVCKAFKPKNLFGIIPLNVGRSIEWGWTPGRSSRGMSSRGWSGGRLGLACIFLSRSLGACGLGNHGPNHLLRLGLDLLGKRQYVEKSLFLLRYGLGLE